MTRPVLRNASYLSSVGVVAMQFIPQLFPDGTASAWLWTLLLSTVPVLLGVLAKSKRAVALGVLAGVSPILLLWMAFALSLFIYFVTFGRVVWI